MKCRALSNAGLEAAVSRDGTPQTKWGHMLQSTVAVQ